MKYKYLFTMLVLSCLGATFFGVSSCKDDDDDGGNANCATQWALDVQDELDAMINAAQAYGTNPSTANCSAYKNAVQNYIDAVEPYGVNCPGLTGTTRDQWQDALDQAEASLSTLPC